MNPDHLTVSGFFMMCCQIGQRFRLLPDRSRAARIKITKSICGIALS